MQERIKIFSFVTGHGETLIDPPNEEHINQWLADTQGQLIEVSQSESQRPASGQHVTVCVWYVPAQPS